MFERFTDRAGKPVRRPGCPMCNTLDGLSSSVSFIADLHSTCAILSDNQGSRGWCVLVLRDHEEHLAELGVSGQSQLWQDVARVAAAIRSVFPTSGKDGGPPRINYECLGNQVPHIHWHIIPRHADDPDPTKTVWTRPEAQLRGTMTAADRAELIEKLRAALHT